MTLSEHITYCASEVGIAYEDMDGMRVIGDDGDIGLQKGGF